MAKTLDCGIVVREFELQLPYFVYFWTNNLAKDIKPFLSSQVWVKLYHECPSRRMGLVSNNSWILICHEIIRSKLARGEHKTRHDWEGKMIHWKLCQNFKFNHTNKWYMQNPASLLENVTHKLLWYFAIQKDHLISKRQLYLIIIKKKKKKETKETKENVQNCELCCSGWPQGKI